MSEDDEQMLAAKVTEDRNIHNNDVGKDESLLIPTKEEIEVPEAIKVCQNEQDRGNKGVEPPSDIQSSLNCHVGNPINGILCAETTDLSVDNPEDPVVRPSSLPNESLLEHTENDTELDEITEDSNMKDPKRRIWIVTTAALPWMTGTAVNPLLRALYLTRGRLKHHVTLVIPWLNDEKARTKLYGKDCSFPSRLEQEVWIREYCRVRAHCVEEEANLKIAFYDGVYHDSFGSIFPSVDICGLIPNEEADICILEEPEHLNWFRVPSVSVITHSSNNRCTIEERKVDSSKAVKTKDTTSSYLTADELHSDKEQLGWAHKFRHVVGILHTNYSAYMTQYSIGTSFITAPAIGMMSSIVVRAYCHKVIRLSAVLPSLAPNKEVTCNVHGVRSEFLEVASYENGTHDQRASVYFIGKLIWAKGFDKLLEMQEIFKHDTGEYFKIDIYGGGSDEKAIFRAFHGRKEQKPKEHFIETGAALNEKQSAVDAKAALIFGLEDSVKKILQDNTELEMSGHKAIEVTRSPSGRHDNIVEVVEESNPLAIFEHISGKTVEAGLSTSKAVYRLADSILQAGLKMTFSLLDDEKEENTASRASREKVSTKKAFYFDPPRSKYEFRHNAIPAGFLGVKDHAVVRDIAQHRIFLNMSTTEVLCTTTAEALAMGKFAIVPRHRKSWLY